MKVVLVQYALFGVVFLGMGIGIQKYFEWASKYKDEVATEKITIQFANEVSKGGYQIIDVNLLKDWIDEGKNMVVVDTMPISSYDNNHIPNAIQFLFPIPEMLEWDVEETGGKTLEDYEKSLGEDKSIAIVLYCGFVKCSRSHNAALWARKLGYENVYRLPGGIFAWMGADYDTESA